MVMSQDDVKTEKKPTAIGPKGVKVEELLRDLLEAIGIVLPQGVKDSEFKRALYHAAMEKISTLLELKRLEPGPGVDSEVNNPLINPGGDDSDMAPVYMSLNVMSRKNSILRKQLRDEQVRLSLIDPGPLSSAELDALADALAGDMGWTKPVSADEIDEFYNTYD